MSTVAAKPIPMDLIDVPDDNRDDIDPVKLRNLADTMDKRGLLAPVVVRPHKKVRYRLVAGERRLRAARLLGWKEIEAKVVELSDVEAAEVNEIENLQREDLTPWEHARKIAAMREANPRPVEELAARLGRSPRWVAIHLAIAKLTPDLAALVREQDWPMSHLPLLARIPAEQQPAILQAIRDQQTVDWFDYHPKDGKTPAVPSLRELQEFLGEYQRRLSAAPWKLADAGLLPQAGACSACEKRSGAQSLLFPELADPKADSCLDEGCWKAKEAALVSLNISKATGGGKPCVLLKQWESDRVSEELANAVGPAKFESSHNYIDCKKSDKGAVKAVVVTGPHAGSVRYVRPVERAEGVNGKSARPVDQETGEPAPPTNDERLANLRLKRQCVAAELWSGMLETLKIPLDVSLPLLVFFGTDTRRPHRIPNDWTQFGEHKTPVEVDAWSELIPVFRSRLLRSGPMTQGEMIWNEAAAQAEALKQEPMLQRCWAEACVSVPLPKTLKGVDDDTSIP